jgi:DNA-binding MarR family transcriptional regulator
MAVSDYGVNLTMFRNTMSLWQGINPIDMDCLRFLFLKGTSKPSEVSRYTRLTSGATTALLDRLEKAGFIERRPNPDDRRGTLIIPAERAAEKVAAWFESSRNAQDELLASYSEGELELIVQVFERFAQLWRLETEAMRRDLED